MRQTLMFLFILPCLTAIGQKIVENKVDDFLNVRYIKTDWTQINAPADHLAFFRVSTIDSAYYLEYKKVVSKAYTVERQRLMVKFQGSEDMAEIESTEQSNSCNGCGAKGFAGSDAWGIHMVYKLEKEDVERFRNEQVAKMRIYTGQGYIEEDFTNEKRTAKALTFQKAFMLIMAESRKKQ